MITCNDIAILLDPEIREYIRRNRTEDPARIALSLRQHGALIATQVKYLQRARTKLPSYYEAGCIIPPLAFEQCSSEETATAKHYTGHTCLDLTCGLGVDSLYLSKHFKQVIAIERDPALSEITRTNFGLLGAENITVVNSTAEAFLDNLEADYRTLPNEPTGSIDLIYIDPARRDEQGNKVWLLEDCSPDVIRLMPRLLALSPRVVVKASPLFDVDEAFRLFGESATVEVVSLRGECKEVLIEIAREESRTHKYSSAGTTPGGLLKATIAGGVSLCFNRRTGKWTNPESVRQASRPTGQASADTPIPSFLLIPDVTLYKARLVEQYAARTGCKTTSATGYCFGECAPENFFGKAYRIREAMPYRPKMLKQFLKQTGISRCNILKKDFPLDAGSIAKALGIRQGGTHYAAFTRVGANLYVFLLDAEMPLPAETPLHG